MVDIEAAERNVAERLSHERMELRGGLQEATAQVGAAELARLRWIAACDEAALHQRDGHRHMAAWLAAEAGISQWKAARMIACSRAIDSLPLTAAGLQTGALSIDKVVELTASRRR